MGFFFSFSLSHCCRYSVWAAYVISVLFREEVNLWFSVIDTSRGVHVYYILKFCKIPHYIHILCGDMAKIRTQVCACASERAREQPFFVRRFYIIRQNVYTHYTHIDVYLHSGDPVSECSCCENVVAINVIRCDCRYMYNGTYHFLKCTKYITKMSNFGLICSAFYLIHP